MTKTDMTRLVDAIELLAQNTNYLVKGPTQFSGGLEGLAMAISDGAVIGGLSSKRNLGEYILEASENIERGLTSIATSVDILSNSFNDDEDN